MADGAGTPSGPAPSEAWDVLRDLGSIDLDRCRVVGECVRFDEEVRNSLKEFRRMLVGAFQAESRAPENFLVWGAPGTGKSYLVQQLARSLGDSVRYVELNLAQLSEAEFRARLDEVAHLGADSVCLVDEVDAKDGQSWPYEVLLPYLEPSVPPPVRTVYVLAGSGGGDLAEFRRRLAARPKGPDLLSRIGPGHQVRVPPLGVGDRILVAATQLRSAARDEGREPREIERLALYYIAVQPAYSSARQLRGLAVQAARRIPKGEDRIRYDDLFRPGDPENKEFWAEVGSLRTELADRFVPVTGGAVPGARSGTIGSAGAPSPPPPPANDGDRRRIAILPFVNISPDPSDAYFADGLTEELISTVSQIGGLRVIARTSVMRYRDHAKGVGETGRELRVGSLLEGSVRKAGNELRVTAQLIDVPTEEPRWTSTFDRRLENVFAIQQELARRIAQSLEVKLVAGESARLAKTPTHNLEAYELYLLGRFHFPHATDADLTRALSFFERAVELDPSFALAHCGIAECHAIRGNREFVPLGPALEHAEREIRIALDLDPDLAEAYIALGPVLFNRYDWAGSLATLERGLALDPNNAQAHFWRSVAVGALGRPAEGLDNARRAVDLDPLTPRRRLGVAQELYWMRRYEDALAALALPGNGGYVDRRLAGYLFFMLGRVDESLRELRANLEEGFERPAAAQSALGAVCGRVGRADEARALLRELERVVESENVPKARLAWVHVGLGEFDAAFRWYERALAERSMGGVDDLLVDPFLDEFRRDPRAPRLLARFGFPVGSS